MKAVLLAGGRGERLAPLTESAPKPLMRVLDTPVIEYAFATLKRLGITSAAVTTCYRAEDLRRTLGEVVHGVSVQYFAEETPLGTAGAVKACEAFLDEDFLVLSADALFDFDLEEALFFHRSRGALATLVLTERDDVGEYGLVKTDAEGRILGFSEKPSWEGVFSNRVNCGIYVCSRALLDEIPCGRADFSRDLFPRLLEKGCGLYGAALEGFWCDIGSPEALHDCNLAALHDRVRLPISPRGRTFSVGEGKSFLGEGAVLLAGARIESSVIGAGSRIASSLVQSSVLGRHSHVEEGAVVSSALTGDSVRIKSGAYVAPGSVLAESAVVECGAHTRSFERVGLGQTVRAAKPEKQREHLVHGTYSAQGETERVFSRFVALGEALYTQEHTLLCCAEGELSAFALEALVLGAQKVGATVSLCQCTTADEARSFAAALSRFTVFLRASDEAKRVEAILIDENGLCPSQTRQYELIRALQSKNPPVPPRLGRVYRLGTSLEEAYDARLTALLPTLEKLRFSHSQSPEARHVAELLCRRGAVRAPMQEGVFIDLDEGRQRLDVYVDGERLLDREHLCSLLILAQSKTKKALFCRAPLPRALEERLKADCVRVLYPEAMLLRGTDEVCRRAAVRDFDLYDLMALCVRFFACWHRLSETFDPEPLREKLCEIPFALHETELCFDPTLSARFFSCLWERGEEGESGLCLRHEGGVSYLYPDLGRVRILSESESAETAVELCDFTEKTLRETLNTLSRRKE